MKAQLKKMINNRQDIWCASRLQRSDHQQTISTQHGKLDQTLSQSGWPLSCTTELLTSDDGGGEFSLLLPALAKLSQEKKWIAFIAPPSIPYGPALSAAGINTDRILMVHPRNTKELLWATEQALKTGTCSAVISWFGNVDIADSDLRRIQAAANLSQCLHIQYRDTKFATQPSPAALRLNLSARPSQLKINVVKQRGSWGGQELFIDRNSALTQTDIPLVNLDIPKKLKENSHTLLPASKQNTEILWQ